MCSKAYRITNAKAYVFSDSVLCVGKWEMILWQPGRAKLNGIRKTITSRNGIESTVCRRSSSGKYSEESQRWEGLQCEPEHFKDRASSCQCTATLQEEEKERQKDVNTIHRQLRIMLINSVAVIGLSWEPGSEKKWHGTCTE